MLVRCVRARGHVVDHAKGHGSADTGDPSDRKDGPAEVLFVFVAQTDEDIEVADDDVRLETFQVDPELVRDGRQEFPRIGDVRLDPDENREVSVVAPPNLRRAERGGRSVARSVQWRTERPNILELDDLEDLPW